MRTIGRVLLAVVLCLSAVPAWSAAAHVRTATPGLYADTATATATFSGSTSAGGLIVVGVIVTDGATVIGTPTDTALNTYTAIGAADLIGGATRSRLFYAKNVTGGTNIAVTAVLVGTAYGSIIAHEASGLDTTAPLDQEAQNAQTAVATTTNAVTSSADTTTANGEYIFGMTTDETFGNPTQTSGTGFTTGSNSSNDNGVVASSEYQVQTSAGSIAATFTHSVVGDTVTLMATFKAAGGAAGTNCRKLLLLGVGGSCA